MSMALVTKGRLYPKASSSGEPIVIVRRDHFMDIHAEILDIIEVSADVTDAEEIAADISMEIDEIEASVEVAETIEEDVVDGDVIQDTIEEC